MAIMSWGEKMRSAYLERVSFREGVDLRIALLAVDRVVGQTYHYLSFEEHKGGHECIGGVCCQCFGAPAQRYYLPCWVYNDPARSAEGTLQALALTKGQYEDFVKLETQYRTNGYSIAQFDFIASTHKQGKGTRTTFNVVMGQSLLNYLPPEQKAKMGQSMEAFYVLAETSLQKPMTPEAWMKVLEETGTPIPSANALPQFNPNALPAGGMSGQAGFGPQTSQIAAQAAFPPAAQPAVAFPTAQPASPFPGAQQPAPFPANQPAQQAPFPGAQAAPQAQAPFPAQAPAQQSPFPAQAAPQAPFPAQGQAASPFPVQPGSLFPAANPQANEVTPDSVVSAEELAGMLDETIG